MEATKIYSCIIIDDETLARQLIQTHLSKFQNIHIVGSFNSAIEAKNYLINHSVDLIFLDIQMPHLTGIDFLKSLITTPKVIFTTAYSEFAIEGYELNIIDYLLKPITFERFYKAVNKALEILKLEQEIKEQGCAEIQEKSILIKSSHQLIKIELTDILYIEGLHKYIKIVTKTKNYTSLFSLTAIETKLPSINFYRCHRSFIVNLNAIKIIEGNQALIDIHKIPISKTNKLELIGKLGLKIG